MMDLLFLWALLCLDPVACVAIADFENNHATFIVLGQNSYFDSFKANATKQSILRQSEELNKDIRVIIPHMDFSEVHGFWAMWTLISRISQQYSDWYIFLESDSHVNANALFDFLQHFNSTEKHFIGCGLYDESPVIIHHFFGHDTPNGEKFFFPDSACGIALSRGLVANLSKSSESSSISALSSFSIDAKHEIAMYVFKVSETLLSSYPDIFCSSRKKGCAVFYEMVPFDPVLLLNERDVLFAVKTYHGNHDTRVPVIKRTWAASLSSIQFFSDVANESIPTIDSGVPNTSRGHCAKTLVILKFFVDALNEDNGRYSWLFIADDDTLLSITRLLRLLSCYDNSEKVILGERYGYGFSYSGHSGYDYPTGGSGMAFSPEAAKAIVSNCSCPEADSPDDMIIGICARRLDITVLHNAAFHQARPIDYPEQYLRRIPAISFHKFNDIDPYHVYLTYLYENGIPEAEWKQEL